MAAISLNQKPSTLSLWNKKRRLFPLLVLLFISVYGNAQCLSSVNPVGGTNNLLVLEQNSLRIISFYKYGQGNQYYEGTSPSDFDLISKAWYNYLSTTLGYGLTRKITLELETGYFFNKTQNYDLTPQYRLTGQGLSNINMLGKFSLFSEPVKRIYITGAAGAKIPWSREPQFSQNVQLPVEVQPTIGAYGAILSASFVKENSASGIRYFVTSRMETSSPNKNDYKLGNSYYTSIYVSKHLMFPWLKGDWTAILQLRNEIRESDKIEGRIKESSGSTLFFVSPQINYVLKEKWYLSGMIDIPVYQNFNGTQLGAGPGFTFILSRTFRL